MKRIPHSIIGYYTVVENSGYEGERDVMTFNSYRQAAIWRNQNYDPDEINQMHVEIAYDNEHGRTYEL